MKDQDLQKHLDLLAQHPPGISISTVTHWVATGRSRPRFHALAWLSRVGWRWPN